jgi:hypothetical protein
MAAQKGFTREDAIAYLAERKLLTKTPDSYTTPYLKRLASSARKAERENREFTREEARGHARARVDHLEKDGHRLDQYKIEKPPKRDLDMRDMANLLAKTKKRPDRLILVIKGEVEDSPTGKGQRADTSTHVETYSFHEKWSKINAYVKNNPNASITEFAEDATGLKWESVLSISFAYSEDLGRHGRRSA